MNTKPDTSLPLINTLIVENDHRNFEQEVRRALATYGRELTSNLKVIVDKPHSFAMKQLLEGAGEGFTSIVVTNNACPEYLEDVWALGPHALLTGGYSAEEIAAALHSVLSGERYRNVPHQQSKLAKREQEVLRFCATGLSNKQIAARMTLSERTVKNYLTTIYTKLGLKNREQATLYYLGIWHWLPEPYRN